MAEAPPGTFDICGLCGWEDDPVQFADHDYRGGANRDSLNECRAAFLDRRLPPSVLAPFSVPDYRGLVLGALRAAGVPDRCASNTSGAVVLERLTRAAGATRWYRVDELADLDRLASRLSPGSCVSFYFDERLAHRRYDPQVAQAILEVAAADGEAVVGAFATDGFEIDMDFIADSSELEQYARALAPGSMVFFGRFPGRDSDGDRAITLDLPDGDGIVRAHPH